MGYLNSNLESIGSAPRPTLGLPSLSSVSLPPIGPSGLYSPNKDNWYKALPFSFDFLSGHPEGREFFLPINPSNVTVVTHFATNVITTIYGTVEEHTNVRYFDITIKGTTGMAPRYLNSSGSGSQSTSPISGLLGKTSNLLAPQADGPKTGRRAFQVSGPALGGLFSKTISAANNLLNNVSDIIVGNDNVSGIDPENSGYMAFHNFYQFLLAYKGSISNPSSFLALPISQGSHPLQFINYKDGIKYDVAIRSFVLERNAENPMLYFYTITMRGYNARGPDKKNIPPDQDVLANLGLSGVQRGGSDLSKMKKIASKARAAAGSLVGGINTFGR